MAMIIPASLTHLEVAYDMQHLFRQRHGFEWRTRKGLQVKFDVEVQYQNHVYSREYDPAQAIVGAYIMDCDQHWRRGLLRCFEPVRHAWSLALPAIIAALFEKPTIYVKETTRHNYTHFVMPAPDPAPVGERYYIFFRPVRENYGYTLIVESAYCMATPPETRSGILFGAMFEKVMS
jgi:hypothetical protein